MGFNSAFKGLKTGKKSPSEAITTKLGRKQVLPCEAENDLAEFCLLTKESVLA